MWASHGMIPDFRARQPRDGPMQCGNQPADISVIHRRLKAAGRRVVHPVRENLIGQEIHLCVRMRGPHVPHLTSVGHISPSTPTSPKVFSLAALMR